MNTFSKSVISRYGMGSLLLGLGFILSAFSGFASQFLDSIYLTGVGIVAVIMGLILTLLPRLTRRQNIISLAISFGVLLTSAGALSFLFITENFIAPLIQTLLGLSIFGLIASVVFASILVIGGSNISGDKQNSDVDWQLFIFGEYHWEKYLFWSAGIMFLTIFLLSIIAIGEAFLMNWKDALILSLLFLILGYLSELRYRLIPNVRGK